MSHCLRIIFCVYLLVLVAACESSSGRDSGSANVDPNSGGIPNPAAENRSAGCNSPIAPKTKSGTYTLTFNGVERTFRLHVPENYSPESAIPMVVVFHGWSGNQDEFLGRTVVTREADKRGYILVAPLGLGSGSPDNSLNSWSFRGSTRGLDGDGGNGIDGAICDFEKTADYNYPSCEGIAENSCAWTQCQQNDTAFVVALLDHINSSMCVDTDNIFASGGSNGGMFTWELGQNPLTAPLFRAIAPIIGLPHRGFLDAHGKNEDMPALLITSNNDPTVPPGDWEDNSFTITSDGDFFFYASATSITKSWAQAHSCDVLNSAVAFDSGYADAECRTYCSNDTGWPRVLDCRSDMEHSYQLNWTWQLILDFFDQHAR